jgi:protein TonB
MFLYALFITAAAQTCDCSAGPAVTPPVQRSGSIISPDYPKAAYAAGAEGTVVFRLDVNAAGRVTGCAIERSSGHPALDSTACSLATRRFRFQPATDASGRPVPGQLTRTLAWRRPAPPPEAAAPVT